MSPKILILGLACLAMASLVSANGKSASKSERYEKCDRTDQQEIALAAQAAIRNSENVVAQVGGGRKSPIPRHIITGLQTLLKSLLDNLKNWIHALGRFPIWLLVNLIVTTILVLISIITKWFTKVIISKDAETQAINWSNYVASNIDQWSANYSKDAIEIAAAAKEIVRTLTNCVVDVFNNRYA